MLTGAEQGAGTRSDPMQPVLHHVVHRELETADTVTLTLSSGQREPGPDPEPRPGPGEPGQFNMLWVPGVGEAAISLSSTRISSSSTGDDGTLVHTLRAVGPVSAALFEADAGTRVGVRGPFGRGWPVGAARGRDLVLVAGGIGLAPLRPVIEQVMAQRSGFGAVTVVVGARSVHDLLFRDEFERWASRGRIEVLATVDHGCEHWRGDVGFVTEQLDRITMTANDALTMVCGPEVMMSAVAERFEHSGVRPERIWLSLERNHQCGIGLCGHCQLGPLFLCIDGPVLTWPQARPLLAVPEL